MSSTLLERPFITVVVPTRNRAALLRDCLKSLVAQDFPSDQYEITVIDDGSRDETTAVANEFASEPVGPRVHLVSQPFSGLNAARNAGLAVAGGDPICFVDDDVEAPPDWLRAMVEGAHQHASAGCLGGRIVSRLEGRVPRQC